MKVSRRGSYANHGLSCITLAKPSFRWNDTTGTVDVKKEVVHDFSTPATHDYTISISPDEVSEIMIVALRSIESTLGKSVVEAIRPALPDILRAVATLIKPFEIQGETPVE